MSTVIQVEDVSKIYRLGQIGSGTFNEDIQRFIARLTGKEDPSKKVHQKELDAIHVALKSVSFDVKDGEVFGIVGKNGAGKSTLLKILSRITSPTTGRVKIKGRVASLLEVGTGFHPELSGRENIYLNGAILGMLRSEVKKKFDEIVEFSGVGKFIDTPVKRYSSGMYVRLAFAVAAHLDPEILIVDEVLAVGDADFQRKCLGKMKDVSRTEGRTVLFVSHNMAAVQSLCTKCVFLKGGGIELMGDTKTVVNKYLMNESASVLENEWNGDCASDTDTIKIRYAKVNATGGNPSDPIKITTPYSLEFGFDIDFPQEEIINFSLKLYGISGQFIINSVSPLFRFTKGRLTGSIDLPANLLNFGIYKVTIMVVREGTNVLFNLNEALTFEIFDERDEDERWYGDMSELVIRPKLNWNTPSATVE